MQPSAPWACVIGFPQTHFVVFIGGSPFQSERLGASGRSRVKRMTRAREGSGWQVADVVAMAIDPAWWAGTARGSDDPVRMAIRIHPGTLTGRATDLTLDPQARRDSELTLRKWPSYTD
jgi:hypothetical protein